MDSQRTPSKRKSMVLVVDDDAAVRNSLKFSLEVDGFSVHDYPDGCELLCTRDLPHGDCLVIDYNLPDMTGLEVLRELRERQVAMPAILITSHPNSALRDRAAAMGARVVEKPLLGETLVESIRDILKH